MCADLELVIFCGRSPGCMGPSFLDSKFFEAGAVLAWKCAISEEVSSCGVDVLLGVAVTFSTASCFRAVSLSMPFFLRKTFIVVRSALLGLQSSALTGSCKQTGQA